MRANSGTARSAPSHAMKSAEEVIVIRATRIGFWVYRFTNHPMMMAIREGLALMMPVLIGGAFAVFLNNLPLPVYQDFMVRIFGQRWTVFGANIINGTFSIMALGMLLSISYSFAHNSFRAQRSNVNPVITALISMASLFALIQPENGLMRVSNLGPLGVFIAIVTACFSSALFIYLCGIPRLRLHVYSNAADNNTAQALSAIVPAFLSIAAFALLHALLTAFGIPDLHLALNQGLSRWFAGMSSTLPTALVFVLLIHVFWFFGIHGNNVLEPLTQSLFVPALAVNQKLAAAGMTPTEIFTKQFFDCFVFLGGTGATLCLIIAILAGIRRANNRKIAAISALPSIFNVNEIMVFGVPIVLNPYLLIPFTMLPVLLTLETYLAMSLGLVPLTVASVEWTTPIFISGYLSTGSIAGSVLQLVNLCIGVALYWPFIQIYERSLLKGREDTLNRLHEEVLRRSEHKHMTLLDRHDAVGNMSRQLIQDLERDMHAGRLWLAYQPQIDSDGRLRGAEALFRWSHDQFGPIAPPAAIMLAEESGLINELGLWIIRSACQQLKEWQGQGMTDLTLSINLTPSQLDRAALPEEIRGILKEFELHPSRVELEITEQTALGGPKRLQRLHSLKEMGFRLAIDDFGMGHSSLMYLKEMHVNTVKLDGSLVSTLLSNDKCSDIIGSIVQLGQSMRFEIIAEYVETEDQRRALFELGCMIYQGHLYSPALPPEELQAFIRRYTGR